MNIRGIIRGDTRRRRISVGQGLQWVLIGLSVQLLVSSCSVRPPEPTPPPAQEAPSVATPDVPVIQESTPAVPAPKASSLPMLHADGTRIADAEGADVVLQGCNLGNWLLLEMWMLDMSDQVPDQYEFEKTIRSRFGKDAQNKLMEIYRANWIKERDFPIIKSFGFNTVRLPFNYTLLMPEEGPAELKPDAFKWLDKAIQWAGKYKLYVILDLHGAPGRQSVDHTTGRQGQNRLWTSPEDQERMVFLWRAIAERYKDEGVVAAYDLLNEPFGDYKTRAHEPVLADLMDRCYRAIREVDTHHIVFFAGSKKGLNFYGSPQEHGWQNMGFTEHFYPGLFGEEPSPETHAKFIARNIPARESFLRRMQVPFLVGEFNVVFAGAGGAPLMRRYYDLYGSKGWAATMWCYKLIQKNEGMGNDPWCMVKNKFLPPLLNLKTASPTEIENYFRWLGDMDYAMYDRLGASMTSPDPPALAMPEYPSFYNEPPAVDEWPGWEATDVGEALRGGQKVLSTSQVEIYGAGDDIWAAHDQFRFVWRALSGDFDLTARVLSLDETDDYAKAGLMLRSTLEPDSAHVLINIFPNGEVILGWRSDPGTKMEQKVLGQVVFPMYLRMRRVRDMVEVGYSSDGQHWTKKQVRTSAAIRRDAYVGLCVLSHDNHILATAKFDEVKLGRAF